MKLNKKGFVLVEFLIVVVMLMTLFVTVYVSLSSSIDKFNKRINYNDITTTYDAFYIRKLYINEEFNFDSSQYLVLYDGNKCDYIKEENKDFCEELMKRFDIDEVIITTSDVKKIKNVYNGKLKDYIKNLSNKTITSDKEYYKLIVKSKYGYSYSSLYTDSDIDKEGPVCNFDFVNSKIYGVNEDIVFGLNCNDSNGFLEDDIDINSIDVLDQNSNILDIKVKSITKTVKDDFNISYLITLDNNSILVDTDLMLRLKGNVIKDKYGNYNNESNTSDIISVSVGDRDEA